MENGPLVIKRAAFRRHTYVEAGRGDVGAPLAIGMGGPDDVGPGEPDDVGPGDPPAKGTGAVEPLPLEPLPAVPPAVCAIVDTVNVETSASARSGVKNNRFIKYSNKELG